MLKKISTMFLLSLAGKLLAVHFTVITPTYNNEKYCLRNIQSVVKQTYNNWNMIIINDCSTDATSSLIHEVLERNALHEKITIIDNTTRKGALKNLYTAIHKCPDEHVILTLDGDDWLATPHALERIAQAYADSTTWLTYGQFVHYPACIKGFCKPFPPEIIHEKKFRSYQWVSSHPRTFYAWLFKKIEKQDLVLHGRFFPMAWDLAIMYPMLEMASNGHICFIDDILYTYNEDNPLNDHKKNLNRQQQLGYYIANLPAYPKL